MKVEYISELDIRLVVGDTKRPWWGYLIPFYRGKTRWKLLSDFTVVVDGSSG